MDFPSNDPLMTYKWCIDMANPVDQAAAEALRKTNPQYYRELDRHTEECWEFGLG